MQITIPQSPLVKIIPDVYDPIVTDDKGRKTVYITINCGAGQQPFQFLLWSGTAYDAAGQYTDGDIATAVADYLSNLKSS